jgi:DNA-binding transcriptional LysR family regulator
MHALAIDTFLAVVRTQSLSGAARELNLAQTTVSQRLKVLEQEMGIVLIERGRGIRQLRLTPVGEQFYKLAEQWNSIGQEIKILQTRGTQLSLVIGSSNSINTFVLPQIYQAMSEHKPPIRLHIRTIHSMDQYTEIEKRQIDVGFALRDRVHPGVQVTKCFSSPMVVLRKAGATGQALANVHPSDLNSDHELLMPWGQEFRIWHEHWWDPLSFSGIRLDNAHLLLHLLQDPVQWAIVPIWIANLAMKHDRYVVYQLTDPPPAYTCYKLVHKHPTSLTARALDILSGYLALFVPEELTEPVSKDGPAPRDAG